MSTPWLTMITALAVAPALAAGDDEKTTAGTPIRIDVTRKQSGPSPELAGAHAALVANRLETAAAAYMRMLRETPENIDALLGMATIAMRQGRPFVAERWYRRVIDADPDNLLAQSALLGLHTQTEAAVAERRLRNLLAEHPRAAALHATLGHLYATRKQWSEAHRAYLDAHAADCNDPDHLFNLAISLDHLGKNEEAMHRYEAALSATTTRAATFAPQQVRRRIAELTSETEASRADLP